MLLHFLCLEAALPVLKLWPVRPLAGPVAPWRVLSSTSNCPCGRICLWKTASSGKVAAFHGGNRPSAFTNTDNVGEGKEKHFVISLAHVKVICQPVSPAVESFDYIALVMLPFLEIHFVLKGCVVFPLHRVSLYLVQCVNDVVRIAGKMTHYYTYCQLPAYSSRLAWTERLSFYCRFGDYVFFSGVPFKIRQFTLAWRVRKQFLLVRIISLGFLSYCGVHFEPVLQVNRPMTYISSGYYVVILDFSAKYLLLIF